jgi:hypothetical protein
MLLGRQNFGHSENITIGVWSPVISLSYRRAGAVLSISGMNCIQ